MSGTAAELGEQAADWDGTGAGAVVVLVAPTLLLPLFLFSLFGSSFLSIKLGIHSRFLGTVLS